MIDPAQDELIDQASAAYRAPPDPLTGALRYDPAWHDLDLEGRRALVTRTAALRALEAAADPAGLSTTARAVLARIRRAKR